MEARPETTSAATHPHRDRGQAQTWVVLPTFEEAETIAPLVRRLRKSVPEARVLVVDDASPDGTGRRIEEEFSDDPKVHLLVRRGRRGRGLAGVEGFRFALGHGAARIVEMDADGSHLPEQVPDLLAALERAPVVLGSRFGPGARDERGLARRILTRIANLWLRRFLGLPSLDCTTGFRAFDARVLKAIDIDTVRATGPEIVQEILVRAVLGGFAVEQVPIRFGRRAGGRSKLGLGTLAGVLAGSLRAGRWRSRGR